MNIKEEKINLITDIYLNQVMREALAMDSPFVRKKAIEILKKLGRKITKQSITDVSRQIVRGFAKG